MLGFERLLQHGRRPRVAGHLRQRFVSKQLGLDRDPDRRVDRRDLIGDRGDRALGERDQPTGRDPDRAAGRGLPFDGAPEHARPQVEHALVRAQDTVPDVERLVVDEQPDQLAVGDVDDGLARLWQPVGDLGVRHRPELVQPDQVAAGQAVRLALVEVRPPADVSVGKGEHRLRLREHVQVE